MKLRFHHTVWMLIFFTSAAFGQGKASPEVPQKVTVCELLSNSKSWNHKLVEVTGFASFGFEDSGFSDPQCESRYGGLWMAYGGRKRTQTISTVNDNGPDRLKTVKVEGITIPLVNDAAFMRFDSILKKPDARGKPGNTVHATVVARFFAGRTQGNGLRGYGHLGCCSLFVIQQVLSTDENRDPTLDPNDTPDQPDRYPFCDLVDFANQRGFIASQRKAEANGTFPDSRQLAVDFILNVTGLTDPDSLNLRTISATPARANYEATPNGYKDAYRVVVSRPAWLAFYASDPAKVTWVILAAYAIGDVKVPDCRGVTSVLK